MRLYVTHFGETLTLEDIVRSFSGYGEITDIELIRSNVVGGRFDAAFVEMPNDDQARAAITGLDGQRTGKRTLHILSALPRHSLKPRLIGH